MIVWRCKLIFSFFDSQLLTWDVSEVVPYTEPFASFLVGALVLQGTMQLVQLTTRDRTQVVACFANGLAVRKEGRAEWKRAAGSAASSPGTPRSRCRRRSPWGSCACWTWRGRRRRREPRRGARRRGAASPFRSPVPTPNPQDLGGTGTAGSGLLLEPDCRCTSWGLPPAAIYRREDELLVSRPFPGRSLCYPFTVTTHWHSPLSLCL